MYVREDESHVYPITQLWVACPVVGSTIEEGPKIEQAMKTNSEDIHNRIFADITGVPPEKDLYTAIPTRSYLQCEDHLVNGKTVSQLLAEGRVETGNNTIISPIQAVVQAERGQWSLKGYKVDAVKLLNFMPYMIEFALPNQLV